MSVDMDQEGRRERSRKLGEAIQAYAEEMGFPGMLGDWCVIGSMVLVDNDGDPNAEYFIALSGGSMLQHHLLGLLAKADQMVDGDDLQEDHGHD